jgi:hypothetical protein
LIVNPGLFLDKWMIEIFEKFNLGILEVLVSNMKFACDITGLTKLTIVTSGKEN